MRVLVCGDRNWTDRARIEEVLSLFPKSTRLIHGACRGADLIAAEVGQALGFDVEAYPVSADDWAYYGPSAGPRRNQRMLTEGRPEIVVAFHPDLRHSKGTLDMVRRARRQGCMVIVYKPLEVANA